VLGVSPYSATVITITNDQVDIDDTDGYRNITSTRVLIADGYRSYSSGDGYLNPILAQEDSQQLMISNGQLTANSLILGPIVFPYTCNGFTGGTNAQLFQPSIGANNNIQVYLQIQGAGLSPTGNYFDVDKIVICDMSGLSYKVVLKANMSVVI
jgi:hypothetical protein